MQFIIFLISIYEIVVLARVLMTWIPNLDYSHPIPRLLLDLTEPLLRPLRNALPPTGMMDLSPLILLLGLQVLTRILTTMR